MERGITRRDTSIENFENYDRIFSLEEGGIKAKEKREERVTDGF